MLNYSVAELRNIPELTKGAVEVSPYEIQQVAEKNKPEQVRFK